MARPEATGPSATDAGGVLPDVAGGLGGDSLVLPQASPTVAVLFARSDSHYSTDPRCEHFDIERDARNWIRGTPIVAHPPCRAWGRLRHLAKPRSDEKQLGLTAVSLIRENGGVLEHPKGSTLWKAAGLPRPGDPPDVCGGFTVEADQWRWGHRAEKMTWFYICGVPRERLPELPPRPPGVPTHVISTSHRKTNGTRPRRPEVTKREREATPPALADWLIRTAQAVTGPPLQALLEADDDGR